MQQPDAREQYWNSDSQDTHLKLMLREAGVSQVEAAARLGIDPRTMRRYLAGERQAPFTVWYCIRVLWELRRRK